MRWSFSIISLFIYLNINCFLCHESTITPWRYDIVLQPDMDKMTFNGSVIIDIYASNDQNDKIRLSTRGLNILHLDLMLFGKAPLIVNYTTNEQHERVEIKMQFLPSGNHSIVINFEGSMNSNSFGFFKTFCHSPSDKSWIAGVSMEPIHARSVFPVFDLNKTRTNVKLKIILSNNIHVFTSNPTTSISLRNGLQEVLVDYGITNIDNIGWVIYPSDGTIRKYEIVGQTVIACTTNWQWTSPISLISKEMSNYTGYDVNGTYWVMLPDSNSPTATSGNITYISEYLMENSTYKSSSQSNEDLMLVAEAYAQQWFKNTIPSSMWSDLWITKGLSKFISYKIAEKLGSNFNSESYIVGNVLPRLLERETIPHSILKHVHSTRDLLSIYDDNLFEKAGLIMRMLEDVMGEVNFKTAIEKFVSQTTGNDYNGTNLSWYFWNSLFENTDKFPTLPVDKADILMTWIRSDSYPIVNAKRSSNIIHISQRKNIVMADSKKLYGYWWVPISVTSQTMRQPKKFWLRPNSDITVIIPSQDKWYLINENGKGFYRVNYDMENWQNLSNAIKNGELNGIAKSRVIDDSLGLAEQHLLGYNVALGLTRHLANEYKDKEPWAASVKHLLTIKYMLSDSKQLTNLWKEYISSLVKSYIYGVDLLSSSDMINLNNFDLNDLDDFFFYKLSLTHPLCRNNDYCSEILGNINILNENDVTTTNYSNGDILSGILCYNIESNSTVWNNYLNLYDEHKSPSLDKTILASLGCSNNVSLIYSYINNMLKTPENIWKQAVPPFISEIATNVEMTNDLLLKFENNFMPLLQFISDSSLFTEIIIPISESLYSKKYIAGMNDMLDVMKRSDLITTSFNEPQYHRAIERIRMNVWRKDMSYSDISNWLEHKENPNIDFVSAQASKVSAIFIFIIVSIIHYVIF